MPCLSIGVPHFQNDVNYPYLEFTKHSNVFSRPISQLFISSSSGILFHKACATYEPRLIDAVHQCYILFKIYSGIFSQFGQNTIERKYIPEKSFSIIFRSEMLVLSSMRYLIDAIHLRLTHNKKMLWQNFIVS